MQANLSRSLVDNRRKTVAGKREPSFIMSPWELQALSETAGRSCVTPSLFSALAPTRVEEGPSPSPLPPGARAALGAGGRLHRALWHIPREYGSGREWELDEHLFSEESSTGHVQIGHFYIRCCLIIQPLITYRRVQNL